MAAPISLEKIDTPDIDQTNFGPNMDRWLANTTDILNNDLTMLNTAFSAVFAIGKEDIGGGGAGPISVTVAGLEPSNYVGVTLFSSSNGVKITTVTVGSGSFSVEFSADPGASAIIAWQAFVVQPK